MQPGTRYLVLKVPYYTKGRAGGLGDRLRTMVYSTRAAYALQRVLLLTWEYPHEITNFFLPAGPINWTVQGVPLQQWPNGAVFQSSGNITAAQAVSNVIIWFESEATVIHWHCDECPDLTTTQEASCILQRLLRPTEEIRARVDQQLLELYNTSQPQFTAVHLRFGGLKGEPRLGQQYKGWRYKGVNYTMSQMLQMAFQSAHRMMHEDTGGRATRKHPILLVTDNPKFRRYIRNGSLAGLAVSPAGEPVHIDLAPNTSTVRDHESTIVDLLLMSRATCLVHSRSMLARVAWLLGGGKPCYANLQGCDSRHAGSIGASYHG
eukprot:gene13981-14096_t